ncbi:hypothetical protein BHM03_00006150 [Ensete ventricosum]|nr:hypothetical protein BHM03_00006150 [Ensete ventricosum]
MRSSNHASALVVCALALAMACTSVTQNTPRDAVDAHNAARAAVGVGPVSWDDNIASYAQKYADKRVADCQLVHSGGPYGENLFWGTGRDFTLTDAVNAWIEEKQYYDYENNSCADGQVCGHYKQVVWQTTTAIGCARTLCEGGKGIFIVCDYSPPGNLVGQRPYEEKAQDDNILSCSSARVLLVRCQITMSREKKTSKGKQRIEIKKIENEEARYISFSKRRNGIYGKASELSTLCGADLAVLISSPTGKLHSFGSPSVALVVDRFLSTGAVPSSGSVHQEQSRRGQTVQDLNHRLMDLARRLEDAKAKKAILRERLEAAAARGQACERIDNLEGLGLDELDRLMESLGRLKARASARTKEILTGTSPEPTAVDHVGPWRHGGISTVHSDSKGLGGQFPSNPWKDEEGKERCVQVMQKTSGPRSCLILSIPALLEPISTAKRFDHTTLMIGKAQSRNPVNAILVGGSAGGCGGSAVGRSSGAPVALHRPNVTTAAVESLRGCVNVRYGVGRKGEAAYSISIARLH